MQRFDLNFDSSRSEGHWLRMCLLAIAAVRRIVGAARGAGLGKRCCGWRSELEIFGKLTNGEGTALIVFTTAAQRARISGLFFGMAAMSFVQGSKLI